MVWVFCRWSQNFNATGEKMTAKKRFFALEIKDPC